MSDFKRNLSEVWKSWFGNWLNLRKLALDARAIAFDPGAAIAGDLMLHNRPFAFASQALLLPTGLLLATAALAGRVFPIPSPFESAVNKTRTKLATVVSLRDDAAHKFRVAVAGVPPRLRGIESDDLERLHAKALSERQALETLPTATPALQAWKNKLDTELRLLQRARNMRELRLELDRTATYEQSLRELVIFGRTFLWIQRFATTCTVPLVSVNLLMNAALFGWLLRHSAAPFENVDTAARSYFYIIGTINLLPNLLLGFLLVQMDLTFRFYTGTEHFWLVFGGLLWLGAFVSAYALLRLVMMIRTLVPAMRPYPGTSARVAFWHLFTRMVGAHLLISMAMDILLIGVAILAYQFFEFWQWKALW